MMLRSLVLLGSTAAASLLIAAPPSTRPVEGLRENTPQAFALVNARLVTSPGQESTGTIVVRDGVIVAVGQNIEAPSDVRMVDLKGHTIYPGLIDAFSETSIELPAGGAAYWNPEVTPQRSAAAQYRADSSTNEKLRKQGITAQLVAPSGGVIKGTSVLVLTGSDSPAESVLRDEVAQHLRLTVSRGRGREAYPNSPMGAVALARQALYDAQWYRRAWAAYQSQPGIPRPERNDALARLQPYLEDGAPVIIDASNELFFLRADRFAREFGLRLIVRGSGNEYRRLAAIQRTGRPILLPVDFPKPPHVSHVEAALNVDLDDLLHWDFAPENPARLAEEDVLFALTSAGLDDRAQFLDRVRTAVQRGLHPQAALRALTETPAMLFGADDVLGSIAKGKMANLVVTDGELFQPQTKVVETWVRGRRYRIVEPQLFNVTGRWELDLQAESEPPSKLYLQLKQTDAKITGSLSLLPPSPKEVKEEVTDPPGTEGSGQVPGDEPAGDDQDSPASEEKGDDPDEGDDDKKVVKLKEVGLKDARFSCSFSSSDLDRPGTARLTAVLTRAEDGTLAWAGHIVWPDGQRSTLTARPYADEAAEGDAAEKTTDQKPQKETASAGKPASFDVNYPLGAFGIPEPPPQPAAVFFQNATIWTCGPDGQLANASLLIGNGRILAVGQDIQPPADALIVDASGKHITPGIIDCHSHMATDGGVNESTQAITAEVRIGDFIDADDIDIYRQLAGGVTASNILHGSANPIGGQNQVIKLRWGALPEEMKFTEAPPGIKFALGENVKQSNWGDDFRTRYPQTRMGVEQIMRDAFLAAREYHVRWHEWEQQHRGLPPRRDLELEALAEVQAGERWIHCHSYRQDEILALIRTLDEFGITIGTFQHILEGYKVADAMAEHGAMGSAFSDWWAYKLEVYDAIPFAGALMHDAGVVVSFNSDDQELARHLNQEAAKATKYGGVSTEEALKFVTLNPARQLRIEQYVGSLDVGKHADLVVWSQEPLSIRARCEQTWIDGRKYFDFAVDQELRTKAQEQRTALIQKILNAGEELPRNDQTDRDESELWPRCDEFCRCQVR